MYFKDMSTEELGSLKENLMQQYELQKAKNLKLDMSRGKPCPDQLDLSMPVLDVLTSKSSPMAEGGMDCRNYGGLDGIPEAKRLLGEMMEVAPENVFVGGSNSLTLMHDLTEFCYLHPLPGCDQAWSKQGEVKFLCPIPGYDRHFAVTQHFGIQLVSVPMTDEGPDMDKVEELVADPAVKGIWCVPKYSNPTGVIYSDDVINRLAGLRPAAKDFRVFCDNAYSIHDLYPDRSQKLPNIMDAFKAAGNEDLLFLFCSFAKITFGGGGICGVGASPANMEYITRHMSLKFICNDKMNQLRHVRYFGNLAGLRGHMEKMAAILRPKFELVQKVLEEQLGGLDIARWTDPQGGYFVSVDTMKGCAKRTIALCAEAGVVMTAAGASFPYGNDPEDRNIRIAPSYPEPEELAQALDLFCLCVKIASVERLINQK